MRVAFLDGKAEASLRCPQCIGDNDAPRTPVVSLGRIERGENEMGAIVYRAGVSMGSDVGRIRSVLKEIFENAAIRRNTEMLTDSGDIRSREAVIRFKMLIGTVDLAEADLVAAFHELWTGREDERAHTDLLSKVGYEFWPQNAAEFLSRFIAERTGGIRKP